MTGSVGGATAAAQMGAACAASSAHRSGDTSVPAPAGQPLMTREAQEAAYQEAMSFQGKDFAEMIRRLKPLAKAGHAGAQFYLGRSYDHGETTGNEAKPENRNLDEAIKWYQRAAEQGHASAQFNLGCSYDRGKTTGNEAKPENRNFSKAIKWYQRAAEQGHAKARFNLGYSYEHGDTTGNTRKSENVDHPQACLYFRKAFPSPDLGDKYKKNIKNKITHNTTSGTPPECQVLYTYHLKLIENPTYIQDTIEHPSTDAVTMKALIEDLIQYERPLLEQAEFQAYLHQILNKDIAYLDHMLPLLSLEDKIALSGHLQRLEDHAPYFSVMQAIVDDPTLSRQLKAEYQFYRHDEMMKAEILAECASRGVADLDALCKTAEGFKAYQDIFTPFKPAFIECSREMSDLKAQGIIAREDDMISKPIKNTLRMYRDYKQAIKTQEVQAMVQQMMAAGADKVAGS